jgi:hypothetical protein
LPSGDPRIIITMPLSGSLKKIILPSYPTTHERKKSKQKTIVNAISPKAQNRTGENKLLNTKTKKLIDQYQPQNKKRKGKERLDITDICKYNAVPHEKEKKKKRSKCV